jgi:hypothetical protein
MRDFKLHIPRDCVAANSAEETNYALGQMKSLLKADICPSDEIDFRRLGVRPSELGGGK